MMFESSSGLLNWPLSDAVAAAIPSAEGASELRGVVSVLSAIDELSNCASLDALLSQAVEVVRRCVGLERVALYVSDTGPNPALRGTWGTGMRGEPTDERGLTHVLSDADRSRLLEVQSQGSRWMYFEHAPLYAQEPGRSVVIGQGWLVITPVVSDGTLLGVLYNDAALSGSSLDLGKQVRAAVFCSLLAGLIRSRQQGIVPRISVVRETERGSVVRQIQRAVSHNPMVSGEQLARELGISAGYLARLFKTEVGLSLVEYRNRIRIERFLRLVERGGGNLYEAAFEAGFGSYAQFHRVFRRHVGTTPREYVTGNRGLGTAPLHAAAS